jgi:hypothetical protein
MRAGEIHSRGTAEMHRVKRGSGRNEKPDEIRETLLSQDYTMIAMRKRGSTLALQSVLELIVLSYYEVTGKNVSKDK